LRLTKEQAEHNRHLMVETASRMFRLHGMENVAVADIMKESGFTDGGFHNHFKSIFLKNKGFHPWERTSN
jgi:TetR/AcrR family transcriptional repressor of nem operon